VSASTITATDLIGNVYGPVVGSNTVSASTVTATNLVGTLYGPVAGSNTVSASTIYGTLAGSNTVSASTVTATNLVGSLYGPVTGSNTIDASTVTATSLIGTLYGPLAGANTISGSSISGTTLYGSVAGSNTVSASTVTATSLVGTLYGPLAGANTISASAISATTLYGTLAGANTVSASTIYGPIAGANTIAASSISGTTLYGPISGSNTISATVVTASSNVNAPTMNVSIVSNAASFVTINNVYAANAIQTTNILSTSLTSNSTNTNITSTLNISSLLVGGSTAGVNQTLITTGTGAGVQWGTIVGSQWTTGTGNIYYISNVGIGTSAVSANLSVVGNIYASNAIQTTNIISAGFTSNATNVNFNFDTISIPYLNVTSSSTISSLILQTVLSTAYGGTGADGSAVTANKFLGSPSGATGGVSYRVLASADLPTVTFSPGSAGTYGSSSAVPTIVVDTYGRITGISTSAITSLSGLTTYGVLYATSSTAATTTAVGTTGQPLLSGGTGAAPSYGTLSVAYGGTGQTTSTAGFNALSPMSTLGDLIYGGATGSGTRLAGNTTATKNFLVQTGTGTASDAPTWGTLASGDIPNNGANTTGSAGSLSTTFTSGYVLYGQGTGVPAYAAGHYWDNTNGRLGIGTASPGCALSFGATTNNKILSLYDGNSSQSVSTGYNFYGFGVNSNYLRFQAAGSGTNPSDGFYWYSASTERMRIEATTGHVGIGTTDASTMLDVQESVLSGRTAYLNFNGNITEQVSGYTTTYTGSTASYVVGAVGSGYYVGTAGYLVINYSPTAPPFSFAFWLKPVSPGASQTIFSINANTLLGTGTGCNIDWSGSGTTYVMYLALPNQWTISALNLGSCPAGVWTHLCVTVTSGYVVTTYNNGTQTATATGSGNGLSGKSGYTYLGANGDGGTRYANASYDEFCYYNRALETYEITALANSRSINTNKNIYTPANLFIGGNVGIGTTTPGSALSFGQPVFNKIITLYDGGASDPISTATNFYGFGINGGVLRYQCTSGANHVWYEAGTERMRILTGGNVGIGTAAPVARLDVWTGTARSGTAPASYGCIYATADSGGGITYPPIAEFRHSNQSQGLGINFNSIFATGSNTSQPIYLYSRGASEVQIIGSGVGGSGYGNLLIDYPNSGSAGGCMTLRNSSGGTNCFASLVFELDGSTATTTTSVAPASFTQGNGMLYCQNTGGPGNNASKMGFIQWNGGSEVETMTILPTGHVGIGTATPGFRHHVYNGDSSFSYYGPNATWSSYLIIGAGTNQRAAGRAQLISTNGNLHMDAGTGQIMYLNYYSAGDGVGAECRQYGALNVTGDVTAFYSDERLKTKVGRIENPLDKVCSLTAFKYVHNEIAKSVGFEGDGVQVGLSAQEVQNILPEVVARAPFDEGTDYDVGKGKSKSGQDYLTLKYERLVPLLVEALKEERAERLKVEERIARLEKLLLKE
jgi:hypothetical protein